LGIRRLDRTLLIDHFLLGPGGFSEYVLWRRKWRSKGFGFTLKGVQDFKLEDFFAGPAESFETHYGEGGVDGDGDVFKERNIRTFQKYVLQNTDGQVGKKGRERRWFAIGMNFKTNDHVQVLKNKSRIFDVFTQSNMLLCAQKILVCRHTHVSKYINE
jgi:hypothetical protein